MRTLAVNGRNRIRTTLTSKVHPASLLPLCLVVILMVLYGPGRLENTSGDNISARYWPVAVLKHGTVTLNPFRQALAEVRFATMFATNGDWVPRTNWGMLPMMLPVYALADAYNIYGTDWTDDRISQVGRLTGIVWAISSAVLLYYFFANIIPLSAAFLSALLFGVGTWNLSMGAQGVGLQAATVLLLTVNMRILWGLSEARPQKRVVWTALVLGLLHGLVWSIRPQDMLLVVPVGLLLLERRVLVPYLIVLVACIAATSAIYISVYNYWLGQYGYGIGGTQLGTGFGTSLYRLNFLPGFLGILFSPNYGAIVFFPLLFLVPVLWWKLMPMPSIIRAAWRGITGRLDVTVTQMQRISLVLGLGAGTYFLYICSVAFWHGGWAYGPRYLYDVQPYLWVPIGLAVAELLKRLAGQKAALGTAVLAVFTVLSLQGVAIHALGARNFDIYIWNVHYGEIDDADAWDTSRWIIADTWNAGSNANRWANARAKLRDYGF